MGPAAYRQKRCDTNGLQLKEDGASHIGKRRFFAEIYLLTKLHLLI